MKVTLDFETYSEVDVRKVGAEAYARHPSTNIICMTWAIGEDEPQPWVPGDEFPEDLFWAIIDGTEFEAHNAAFERAIWNHVAIPRYQWPEVAEEQWRCTLAACAYRAVAVKLATSAEMLGLTQQKDMAGQAAMRYLSSPRRTKKHGIQRRQDQERLKACVSYCAQDVRTEQAISTKVGPLPPAELDVWKLDQKINQRGMMIDQDLCRAAIAISSGVTERLFEEFADLTGGLKPTQREKVLAWLKDEGLELPNLTADTVGDIVTHGKADGVPAHLMRAMEIRQQTARSSLSKYEAALNCVCPDGRARGLLQYHGAGTGRWAGRLIQPQNMVRPSNELVGMEELCDLIKQGDTQLLEMIFGDPMIALSDATRGIFIPSPGNVLACWDFASIEAVILACIAGEEWKIEAFREKRDVYSLFAEMIYGHPINKKDHPEQRQAGKAGELAFGYQGGVGAWRKFDTSDRHTDEQVNEYKNTWRAGHPRIKAFWPGLDHAALAACNTGEPHEFAGFRYEVEGDWLSCRLLSGRKLWYYDPAVTMETMPWLDHDGNTVSRPQVNYLAYKEGQIKGVRGYAGHWTENIVQALSRDKMVEAMFALENEGFPLTLTVHDEIIADIPERDAARAEKRFPEIMAHTSGWNAGWPIRATGGILRRYQK